MRHRMVSLTIAVIVLGLLAQGTMAGGKISLQTTVIPVRTGQTYVPTLRLFRTPLAGRVPSITVHKVAIFPFADYTHQQSFIRPLEWGANRIIIESLTDRFLGHGIAVVLQDDVEGQLVAEGLLRPPGGNAGDSPSPMEQFRQRTSIANTPEYELYNGMRDDTMRAEIMAVIRTADYFQTGAMMPAAGEPFLQGITSGILQEKILNIGRQLDVDLIIRGRILEYGVKFTHPGAAVIQLRVYAQDARTGELFWSNRAEIEVRDDSASSWAPPDLKALFDYATRETIQALMADFFGER